MSAFRLKTDSTLELKATAGTIVFEFTGCDYGLSDDDTRHTGIEHVSVTLRRGGGHSSFTHPKRDLEPCQVNPLSELTDEHVHGVCLLGQGDKTCRYLAAGAAGFSCEKHTDLAETIDRAAERGGMKAKGNNCDGRASR